MGRDAEGPVLTALTWTIRVPRDEFSSLQHLDLTPAYARFAAYFIREMDDMFDTGGASRGHPWKPLRPSYAARKAKAGRSAKILHLTGVLRASFGAMGQNNILEITPTHARVGSRDPKASWHDAEDASRRAPGVPERPLIRPLLRDFHALAMHVEEEIMATAQRGGAPS